jgi:hypothetical protein
MPFDPTAYGPDVQRILAFDGDGLRLMPLAGGTCSSPAARKTLAATTAAGLFPASRAAESALSGLWLYFSCLDESHTLSQDIETPEGSFWHGILHRQEPDPANAGYWFRQVGRHPIFPVLHQAAADIAASHPSCGFATGASWDPLTFIDFVETARRRPGTPAEQAALEIQRAEWQLLFHYCAENPT